MPKSRVPQGTGTKTNRSIRAWRPKVKATELSSRQLWVLGQCYKHCVKEGTKRLGLIYKLGVYAEGVLPFELDHLAELLDFKSYGRHYMLPYQLVKQNVLTLAALSGLEQPIEGSVSGESALKASRAHGKPIGSTFRKWNPKVSVRSLSPRQREVLVICHVSAEKRNLPSIGRIRMSLVAQEKVSRNEVEEIAELLDFKKYDKRFTIPLQLLRDSWILAAVKSWEIKHKKGGAEL